MWAGRQAAAWGLTGVVDAEVFLALLDGAGPSGDQLGRGYGERSVRGYDITFSAPKSASTLWALGDKRVAGQALAAHDRAVEAVLGFVDRNATTRATIDGTVQHVDADGLAMAVFRQHTSRLLDPQLHSRAVVAAKEPAIVESTPVPRRRRAQAEGGWPERRGRGHRPSRERVRSAPHHSGVPDRFGRCRT